MVRMESLMLELEVNCCTMLSISSLMSLIRRSTETAGPSGREWMDIPPVSIPALRNQAVIAGPALQILWKGPEIGAKGLSPKKTWIPNLALDRARRHLLKLQWKGLHFKILQSWKIRICSPWVKKLNWNRLCLHPRREKSIRNRHHEALKQRGRSIQMLSQLQKPRWPPRASRSHLRNTSKTGNSPKMWRRAHRPRPRNLKIIKNWPT